MSATSHLRAAVLGTGLVLPENRPALVGVPGHVALEEGYGYVRSAPVDLGALAPGLARRLGRSQRMMVGAAGQAVSGAASAPGFKDAAVAVGTGLGALEETIDFLDNMVRLDEREPRPARFTNSVNNSAAASVAVAFGLTGENRTIAHESISFEMALWHAMQVLRAARAPYALVGGVDEINAYVVSVGRAWGLWRAGSTPITPMAGGAVNGTLPGEGAAALLLAADDAAGGAAPLPKIVYTRARALAQRGSQHVDVRAEADFVLRCLATADVEPQDVDMVLLGANGDCVLDAFYERIVEAVAPSLSPNAAFATYKGACGEFYASSAVGAVLATRTVAAGSPPPEVALVRGSRPAGRLATVLVYSLTQYAYHSVSVVTL